MKTIIRNFINVLIRFKVATFLNVAGLAVAFAAFLIIMMQVSFEHNFDRCHPNSTRIYRMGLSFPDGASMIHCRPLIESFIHSSPHIEAGTLINPYIGEMYVTVTRKEGKQGFKETIITCHPEITRMFQFTMRTGKSLDTGKYGSPVIWKGIGNWKADRFRWWDLDKTGCEIFGRRRCL